MSVSWVYRLSKEELIRMLQDLTLTSTGNLAELRQRMVAYVRANPQLFKEKPEDDPAYNEELDRTADAESIKAELTGGSASTATSSPIPQVIYVPVPTPPAHPPQPPNDTASIMDQMRKWNCHFDGRDVYAFLERIQELQKAYRLTDAQLLQGFPKLLKGDALLWYRNTVDSVTSWAELERNLRGYYLSTGELRHLDRQISDRRQGPHEGIRNYVTALSTLMQRRGGYDNVRQLDTMYYNMKAELRLHIRRSEINSPNELIQQAEELEETMGQIKANQKPDAASSSQRGVMEVTPKYDRAQCCWRCKQRGHSRFDCKNPQKKFCSYCGRDDILTRDCACPKPGNGSRAGPKKTNTRPQNSSKTESS